VFAEGFAFDAMDADIRIDRGLASTKNYRLRGVQASVLMEGQADLAAQTQNLTVFVVPEVNAEGASLAYAAINPVIGFSTLLAQWLLRKPMASAGTSEFHVTGPWDDPKVEPVPRKQPADDVARSNNKPSAN